MKQCTGCGKRYAMTQPNCPSCWSKTWVAAPETGVAELPANPVPCQECGYLASAGTTHCPHCRQSLRPRALTWLGMLGLIGCPLAFVYLIYDTVVTRHYWNAILLLICAAVPVVFHGLLKGEYTAFCRMRLLLIGVPAVLVLGSFAALIAGFAVEAALLGGVLVLSAFTSAILWFVFHGQAVQEYCALGRPKEQYVAKDVFMEQTRATKMERMGSSITRNL